MPDGSLVVAESGLGKPEDLTQLADAGVSTFLIGESLMRAGGRRGRDSLRCLALKFAHEQA